MAKQTTRVRRSFTPQFKKDAVALVRQGDEWTGGERPCAGGRASGASE